ncbi:MAG: hypothetical protein EZS28_044685, partial [Streblomastix strix]
GFDAYLEFYNSPDYWTNQTIIEKDIKQLFKGSKTNAGANSVYYIISQSDIRGSITLSRLSGLSNLIIVLIAVGSVLLVASVIAIIIIVIILCKKKKNDRNATFYERQGLILKHSLRSI